MNRAFALSIGLDPVISALIPTVSFADMIKDVKRVGQAVGGFYIVSGDQKIWTRWRVRATPWGIVEKGYFYFSHEHGPATA